MKKKSLSVQKVILKSFNFTKTLKDKKIFEIFKTFSKEFEDLNCSKKIAISVSGGSDSLALCYLISCYKAKINNKIEPIFYIVDHGLRNGSTKEAQLVKKTLKLKSINLKILKWKGKKPTSNVQSLARQKRYELLFNECIKYNIKTILTAHHQDDIYETFFSRLLRGSGTEGLSSFLKIKKKFLFKGHRITIGRPLLKLTKKNLSYTTNKTFNYYVNDPSNDMDKFQRVRIRKLISNLKDQGLDFHKLNLTLNNLASTNEAISILVTQNISKNVIKQKNKYIINSKFFLFPKEVIFRSFSILIKKISKKDYPPRGKKMINIINQLMSRDHLKATLGGTIIEKIRNSVLVTEEKTKKS